MPLDSQDLYALRLVTSYFPEENANGIGVNNPMSQGVFVVPSHVTGRPDITGYVLRAANNEGKIEWAPSPAYSLTLGELADVNLTGLVDGDVIVYDAATQTWIPGSTNAIIPGDALAFSGPILNVLFDNINIGINGFNQLHLIDHSIANIKLVNDSINVNNADGLTITGSPVALGGVLDIGVDASVIRTTGGQTINGSLGVFSLILNDNDGSNTITLTAPTTVGGNYSIILPSAQGAADTFLQNNGSGSLSWVTISDVTPGAPDGSIQYNNAGSFAGSANLTFDGTDVTLGGTLFANDVITTSDVRLKSDIQRLDPQVCVDALKRMQCYRFRMNSGTSKSADHFGCLAQEIEEILPNIVDSSREFKGINYIMMIPLIIETLKTLL